jgi:hypothetical protein
MYTKVKGGFHSKMESNCKHGRGRYVGETGKTAGMKCLDEAEQKQSMKA